MHRRSSSDWGKWLFFLFFIWIMFSSFGWGFPWILFGLFWLLPMIGRGLFSHSYDEYEQDYRPHKHKYSDEPQYDDLWDQETADTQEPEYIETIDGEKLQVIDDTDVPPRLTLG